jgi:GTP cyclohydrolase I
LTRDEEKDLAEVVLRTRRWAFRAAYPEILGVVRRIMAGHDVRREELHRGADRMIRDYREIISSLEGRRQTRLRPDPG